MLLVAYGPERMFSQLMTFGILTRVLGSEDRLIPSNWATKFPRKDTKMC